MLEGGHVTREQGARQNDGGLAPGVMTFLGD